MTTTLPWLGNCATPGLRCRRGGASRSPAVEGSEREAGDLARGQAAPDSHRRQSSSPGDGGRVRSASVTSSVDVRIGHADRRAHRVLSRSPGGPGEDGATRVRVGDRLVAAFFGERDRKPGRAWTSGWHRPCWGGWSNAVPSSGRAAAGKRLYAAAEPLYSMYYKLRRERDEAAVVENLIRFMVACYASRGSGKVRSAAVGRGGRVGCPSQRGPAGASSQAHHG